MATKCYFQRVQGADSEPIELEPDTVHLVRPSQTEGRSILILESGHPFEVKGTVEENELLIELAKSDATDE